MSDDDISIISLSDDDGRPKQSNAAPQKQPASSAATKSSSKHAVNGTRAAGSAKKSSSKQHAKHTRKPVEPLYEDDEEGPAVASAAHKYQTDDEDDRGMYQQQPKPLQDDLDYLSNRFSKRRMGGTAPTTWLEVDEGEIREVADNLLKNINKAYESENVLQQIFASTSTNDAKALQDPLGMGSIDPLDLRLMAHKWHRGKGDPNAGAPGDAEGAAAKGPKLSLLPPELSPTEEGFDPELYLARFHADSSLSQLRKGRKHLGAELSERTDQLKRLIKSNFERFISCKGTIDDIYLKLHNIENGKQGGSTEQLQQAIEQVQESAEQTFGDVLERAAKTDRIKSVSNLLRRFNNLFGMPSRIRNLAAQGDLEQIVREYRRANALIKPSASTARVWISLYQEIEKKPTTRHASSSQDPSVPAEEVPALIVFLAELTAEKLPGTREEDPMKLYLQCMEDHLMQHMQECNASLDEELSALTAKFERRPGDATAWARGLTPAALEFYWQQQDEADQQEQGALAHRQLLLWPGPPEWSPPQHMLRPTHLTGAAPFRTQLPSQRGPPGLAQTPAALGLEPQPRSSPIVTPGFTPVQCAWVGYMSRLSSEVSLQVPALWAVCTSTRYAQSIADMTAACRKSVQAAAALGQELVARVVQQLAERAGECLDELLRAGPMQPCMELVITDLASTWQLLQQCGCPVEALQELRSCLFRGLGMYTRLLGGLLRAAPQVFLADEDWQVQAASRDSPPCTLLPSKLQAVVASAMHCYSIMLAVASQVPEPPAEESWKPLQEGFFSAFQTYCACAGLLSEQLQGAAAGHDPGAEDARKLPDARTQQAQDERDYDQESGAAAAAAAAPSSGLAEQGLGLERRADQRQGSPNLAREFTILEGLDGTGSGAASQHPLVEGSTKLLVILSDASVLRSRTVPTLVELHKQLLTGMAGRGEKKLQQQLKTISGDLEKLVSSLLTMYLSSKQAQVSGVIHLYIDGHAASIVALRQSAAHTAPLQPEALSKGFHAVTAQLLGVYTEVYTYAPSVLQPVMAAVAEHMVLELELRYGDLDPRAMELEDLLQLFLDLSYLDFMCSSGTTAAQRKKAAAEAPGLAAALQAAYSSLAKKMLKTMSKKGFKPRTSMARAMVGASDAGSVAATAQSLCKEIVQTIGQRSSLNLRCFI